MTWIHIQTSYICIKWHEYTYKHCIYVSDDITAEQNIVHVYQMTVMQRPTVYIYIRWYSELDSSGASRIPGHIWKKNDTVFWQFDYQVIFPISSASFTLISDIFFSRTDVVISKRLTASIPAKAKSQYFGLPVTAKIADYSHNFSNKGMYCT